MSETGEKGVVSGAPSGDLFSAADADEQLLGESAPFRTPGRPQPIGGSRRGIPNKRTAQMRDLYLRMGLPHPLLWMGQVLRMGIDGLALELGVDKGEAAELMRKVAADALPYIEGKQPLRVQAEGVGGLPVMILGDLSAARDALASARAEGALAIDDDVEVAVARHERNQQVSRDGEGASHDGASHGEAKPLTSQDDPL